MHLLQFSTSHYCRKARLALGYKGVAYTVENLTPGLHVLKLKPLVSVSTVPVLLDDTDRPDSKPLAIADSSRIFAHLERRYPQPTLFPTDHEARDRALQLEDWLDESIGTATRFVYYQYRATNGRAIDPSWMSMAVIAIVRQQYGIHATTAELAAERLKFALPWLDRAWIEHEYLVGNSLSIADLTAAALLSPLALLPVYRNRYPALFDRLAAIHHQCREPLPPGLEAPSGAEADA